VAGLTSIKILQQPLILVNILKIKYFYNYIKLNYKVYIFFMFFRSCVYILYNLQRIAILGTYRYYKK
jgi:hypothetical protein